VGEPDKAKQAVTADLRDQLVDGRLRAGGLLPTETQLVARYLVSRQIVRRALRHLAADGLVLRIPGRGTFAAPSDGATSSPRDWEEAQ
jgi:GntR family transcriptional regulator